MGSLTSVTAEHTIQVLRDNQSLLLALTVMQRPLKQPPGSRVLCCLAAVDCPALHHEGDALEYADVVEGIAGDGDDVGIVAGLERA